MVGAEQVLGPFETAAKWTWESDVDAATEPASRALQRGHVEPAAPQLALRAQKSRRPRPLRVPLREAHPHLATDSAVRNSCSSCAEELRLERSSASCIPLLREPRDNDLVTVGLGSP